MSADSVPAGSRGAASPIADLSYRNYDGPLHAHPLRWWIIARGMIRQTLKKKGFWVLAALTLLPFIIPAFQLYFQSLTTPEQLAMMGARPRPLATFFYEPFSGAKLWIFLLALLTGAGSIAGDNRTNALQIYLSKPVTKGDYLIGKWFGIFSVLFVVAALPTFALYIFAMGTYLDRGFFRDHPWLWSLALQACLLPAVLHASLLLGLSAWFKRPVLVGGIYAALYFGGYIVMGTVAAILIATGHPQQGVNASSLSLIGVQNGLAQHIYDVSPTFFGIAITGRRGQEIPRPELWPMLAVVGGLILLALASARLRVRAVEVVRG